MSIKLQKFNKYNWAQDRAFVFTNSQIYNFHKKKLKRSIAITNLAGVTKNLSPGSKEFVIHVQNDSDYRLTGEQ